MKRFVRSFFAGWAGVIPAFGLVLGVAAFPVTARGVAQWQCWEHRFTSASTYDNPYKDVTVDVTFTQGGESFTNAAFWNGESEWIVRARFPSAGTWSWSSRASNVSDDGLHGRSGTVEVMAATGTNPLYVHGRIVVSPDKRYLMHADGTPFLWVGDTAWRGPQAATLGEWQSYINNRAAHNYSVIQLGPYVEWSGDVNPPDRDGQHPWISYPTRINPAFWASLDEKVQYVNDQGLVACFIGLPGWAATNMTSRADRDAFARYLAGRCAGSFAMFSGGADGGYGGMTKYFGQKLKELLPDHLVTHHPGTIGNDDDTSNKICMQYYQDAQIDFVMNQSGHNSGVRAATTRRARVWNQTLFAVEPHKPVVNGEAFYEGDPASAAEKYRGTAHDVRSLGYLSMLSGCCGYTAGVLGLWNWGLISSDRISVPYTTAMNRDSAMHMEYFYRFFKGIDWWSLSPDPSLILDQPSAEQDKMALAKNTDGTLAVAYLPNTDTVCTGITIDLGRLAAGLTARWYNPQTGVFSPGPASLPGSGSYVFTTPDGGRDWVLLLKKAGLSDQPAAESEH